MLDKVALFIGRFLLFFGGFCAFVWLVWLLGQLACAAWISFSNAFRDICNAESLILEYRKNREKFLEWKERNADGN